VTRIRDYVCVHRVGPRVQRAKVAGQPSPVISPSTFVDEERDDSFSSGLDIRISTKTFKKNAPVLDKDWLRRCLALVFFTRTLNKRINKNAPRHLEIVSYCSKKVHGGDARVICPKPDLMRQFTLQEPENTGILRWDTDGSLSGQTTAKSSYAWVYSPPGLSGNLLPGTDTVVYGVVYGVHVFGVYIMCYVWCPIAQGPPTISLGDRPKTGTKR
jgi:hypothetical protein